MTSMPLISVILPAYNAERYIKQAIQSIINQSLQEWELIVVDDASTDNSLRVIKSFKDPRIQVLKQQQNSGYPTAMNVGIARAKGKYIARMDADDISHPERLARQVSFLEKRSDEFCFVGCRRYLLTSNGVEIHPSIASNSYVVEDWDDLFRNQRLFADPTVLVTRELVLKAGGYRTYQRTGQDVDLWLRIMELDNTKPMATLTEPLYGQRLHPKSITYSAGTKHYNQTPRTLAKVRKNNNGDDSEALIQISKEVKLLGNTNVPNEAKHWRIRWLWMICTMCFEVGDYRGGMEFMQEALVIAEPSRYYLGYSIKSILRIMLGRTKRAIMGGSTADNLAIKYGLFGETQK